jgi:precorrin-6A/cobalt-precorrin-6A reductase
MPDRDARAHLLILGGTGEAAALAQAALAQFGDGLRVTTSLAGRTARPAAVAGDRRVGGFGGADGLAAYIDEARVDLVIDATHPFAAQISAQARAACDTAAVPLLLLERPPWERDPRDRWIEVDDVAAAAAALPLLGRRAFLTIGARDLAAFANLREMHFIIRLVDPPRVAPPLASFEMVLGRGPFSLAAERLMLERHGIDVVVAKASGGGATQAKLVAARERGLPVVMLRRPPPAPGARVDGVAAALDWLAGQLAGGGPHREAEERAG